MGFPGLRQLPFESFVASAPSAWRCAVALLDALEGEGCGVPLATGDPKNAELIWWGKSHRSKWMMTGGTYRTLFFFFGNHERDNGMWMGCFLNDSCGISVGCEPLMGLHWVRMDIWLYNQQRMDNDGYIGNNRRYNGTKQWHIQVPQGQHTERCGKPMILMGYAVLKITFLVEIIHIERERERDRDKT